MPPNANVNGNVGNRMQNYGMTAMRNSSYINRELNLSAQGWVGGLVSIANDMGFNRMNAEYGPDGKPIKTMDAWFGRVVRGGQGYSAPIFQAVTENGKVVNKVAYTAVDSAEKAAEMWSKHIKEAVNKTEGIEKMMARGRAFVHGYTGAPTSGVNKLLAATGGASKLIAPGFMLFGAAGDFKEGYREGGVMGGAASAVGGVIKTKAMMELGRAALMNPLAGGIGALTIGGTIYTAHKIFSVTNEGSNYLKMGRMEGISWNRGSTPGMGGGMAATIRGRALAAMENSRFNAMRSLGNESYMITAPRSRYANSTTIMSQAPMLSY